MITFTIPTWNRVDRLRVCLESLIGQIVETEEDIKIAVYNNASDDGTDELLKEFKRKHDTIIEYKNGIEHVRGEESFKRAFLMSGTEWLWMFGDDDILAPNGLKSVIDYIKRKDVDFIHVAEVYRVAHEHRIYRATTLELCEGFGFVDMTGFISGNICKSAGIHQVLNSHECNEYKKSSYFQSLVIMDAFSDSRAAFMNMPIIDLQDRVQSYETSVRWEAEKTPLRYIYTADGLNILKDKGRIPEKLSGDFFRYLEGNLFTKIMYNLFHHYDGRVKKVEVHYWDSLYSMTEFLDDPESMKIIITGFKETFDEYIDAKVLMNNKLGCVKDAHDKSTMTVYPFSYIGDET